MGILAAFWPGERDGLDVSLTGAEGGRGLCKLHPGAGPTWASPQLDICDLGPGMEESECWALTTEFLVSSRGAGLTFLTPGREGLRVAEFPSSSDLIPRCPIISFLGEWLPLGLRPPPCEGWSCGCLPAWCPATVGAHDGGPGVLSSGKAPTLPTWWQAELRPRGSQWEQSWEAPAERSGAPPSSHCNLLPSCILEGLIRGFLGLEARV